MEPTEEQKAILKAKGRVIRINARAGTGKTTTLRMLANEHADKKILYLVFNRKASEEAQAKFPENVTVRTVHSLAWRYVGREYENIGDFSPKDFLPYFRRVENPQVISKITYDFLVYFLNSPADRIEDAVGSFEHLLPEQAKGLYKRHLPKVIDSTRNLATLWNKRQKPCPHDFYLKMFHKLGKFDQVLARYDVVLVDEGQDLSGVMLDALKKCQRRIVVVGDTHQQIYRFRYAIDAMQSLPADENHDLTLSFRFGKPVANLAGLLIREAKGDERFTILGNPRRDSGLAVMDSFPRRDCAILSRTNLSLFANAVALGSKRANFRFERDIEKVLWQTLDIYWLMSGEKSKVRNEWLQSFENMEALEKYADDCDDFQIKSVSQVVRRYGYSFPDLIFEMAEINKSKAGTAKSGGVILSTVHASKGQEYDRVFVDSDIADMLGAAEKLDAAQYDEEVNIAYVGITRAIRQLFIPKAFERVLSTKWQELVKNCRQEPVKRESMPGAAPKTGKKKRKPARRRFGENFEY